MNTTTIPQAKDRLMLVRLSISRWNPRRFSDAASDEVAHSRGQMSSRDVGRFNKVLIALSSIKPVTHALAELRDYHYRSTAPWTDDGVRVLPARMYMDYAKRVGELRDKVRGLVREFAAGPYVAEREAARDRLRDLYAEADYPTSEEIERRFDVAVRFAPLPDEATVSNWGLSPEQTRAMRDEVAATRDEAIRDAHRHVVQQLHDRAEEFVDKVRRFEAGETKGLRATALENLRDVVDSVLDGLNITGARELDQMATSLREVLSRVDVDELRDDTVKRAATRAAVDAIARKFSGAFGEAA